MLKNKIKITFILPSLRAGGAERVISFIAGNLNQDEFEVTLLIIGSSTDQAYDVKNIKTIFLKKRRVLTSIPNLFYYIYKNKPDIVLSSIGHLNVTMGLITNLFPKTVFVGRQTNITNVASNRQNHLYRLVIKKGLASLDYILCQSSDMKEQSMALYGIKENKIIIINNPITDQFGLKEKPKKNSNIIRFITVGRLVQVKGHERILEILSNFHHPFIYTIIGSGPQKNTIKNKITSLNLKNKIKFIEYTNDVANYLRESDFFLQGSYSEGFPNALLESCAVGTPVIAFDAPGGTNEIIENGVNGFIVKDAQEFIYHLNNLKHFDPEKVVLFVQKKFGKKIILRKYEELFKCILNKL